ncbi:hypothetical protein [Brevibacterium aurantiacum]|uniref:hypothetical protein n=1 Tax=Brevibacterium aurantiacum TaxID=273384 RepID=UPI003F955206
MATEPKTTKIQLKFERTQGISERYPTSSATYFITADKAEIMVERDLELRRQEAANPGQVKVASLSVVLRPTIYKALEDE